MGNAAVKVLKNPEDTAKLQKLFRKLDVDGSGSLDLDEWRLFGKALYAANIKNPDEAVQKELLAEIDRLVKNTKAGFVVTRLIDKFGSMTLGLLAEMLEPSDPAAYVDQMFHQADLDKNGRVSFEEFCDYLTRAPLERAQRQASFRKEAADRVQDNQLKVSQVIKERRGFTTYTDSKNYSVKVTGLTPELLDPGREPSVQPDQPVEPLGSAMCLKAETYIPAQPLTPPPQRLEAE